MLHPFISNEGPRPWRIHVVLASTAFHAAVLALAVTPVTPAHFSNPPRAKEEVHYVALSLGGSHREPARATSRRTMNRALHGALLPPHVGPIDLGFALTLVSAWPSLPESSFPLMADSLWGDPSSESTWGRAERASRGPGRALVSSDSDAYIAATVEKSAIGTSDNPKPIYPLDLLNRLIEARFSVFFVVDTSGRIDAATIEIPPSVHDGFARAVQDVLVRWHFFPAEVRGRRVRQLMEQPFEFRIVSGQPAGVGQ